MYWVYLFFLSLVLRVLVQLFFIEWEFIFNSIIFFISGAMAGHIWGNESLKKREQEYKRKYDER